MSLLEVKLIDSLKVTVIEKNWIFSFSENFVNDILSLHEIFAAKRSFPNH